MTKVLKEGELFKLPTWTKLPASKLEELFKLRYFALTEDQGDVRLTYFASKKAFAAGDAPLGSMGVANTAYRRINKLDFVLFNDSKRLWCRAFSQPLADEWEQLLLRNGNVMNENASS